jgi:hypothetical protein
MSVHGRCGFYVARALSLSHLRHTSSRSPSLALGAFKGFFLPPAVQRLQHEHHREWWATGGLQQTLSSSHGDGDGVCGLVVVMV